MRVDEDQSTPRAIPARDERPVLLAVSPVAPWPPRDGMALRVSRLLTELAQWWSIVLVCPSGGESAIANGVALREEILLPRVSQWMYLPSQYDVGPVIDAVTTANAAHKPVAALFWGGMDYLRREVPGVPPSVTDRVDCMTLSAWRVLLNARGVTALRRALAHLLYVARFEFGSRHASSATVVVGEADATVLSKLLRVRNVKVIPNGVDVPGSASEVRVPPPVVMFTGVMSYRPNIDAVLDFAARNWPTIRERVPGAVFQIVGRSPVPEVLELTRQPGIEVHADVESVQTFLSRAWLAVAPMRSGSGIKNKILEAWSVGTPAAMTPIATNGLGRAPSELLLVGEGRELSDLVGNLLLDSGRRRALGRLARSTAQISFSWQPSALALNGLLRDFSKSHSRAE